MPSDVPNNEKSSEELGTPPYSNRGAQNTERDTLRALVDWVSCTFSTVQDAHEIITLLDLPKDKFKLYENGKYGYKSHYRFGHIAIYFDGPDDAGVFLDISGQGCREYEAFDSKSWSQLFNDILPLKYNFTRLDVAIDDFADFLHLPTLKRKVRDGAVRSRFKTSMEVRKTKVSDGSSSGETLYFGSAQSRIQIRFYDKLLEQVSKNKKVDENIKHWTRVEVQLRKEHANAVAIVIAKHERDIGGVVKGILHNYVTFCVKSTKDTNKSRWNVARWWHYFLDDVEKLSLSQVAPDRSIQRSEDWIKRQTTTSWATVYTAYDGDMNKFMNYLIDGTHKMDDKHLDMINRFRLENGYPLLTLAEFHDKLNQNIYDLVAFAKQTKKGPEIG